MLEARLILRKTLQPLYPFTIWLERQCQRTNSILASQVHRPSAAIGFRNIEEIRQAVLDFVKSLRLNENGRFVGYRFSRTGRKPLLYCTLASLLLKHLLRAEDETTQDELAAVASCQGEDGLFRDPVIACRAAEHEDWWGWRHLTMHALMTLSLYGTQCRHRLRYLDNFGDTDRLRGYLNELDWGARAAWTSNLVQNLGVMLQYARDYEGFAKANQLLEVVYDIVEARQDPKTGLHGDCFDTPERLSLGTQATYHMWLLHIYDRRPIPNVDRLVESAARTQNPRGGFGVQWNSSACEDIDSIDILVRLGLRNESKAPRIRASLQRAVPAILSNLNADGSWVFRRDEPLVLPHREMCSPANQGNLFYTWFRMLGLAYCLSGLGDECPERLRYDWQLGWAPGLQLAVEHGVT